MALPPNGQSKKHVSVLYYITAKDANAIEKLAQTGLFSKIYYLKRNLFFYNNII